MRDAIQDGSGFLVRVEVIGHQNDLSRLPFLAAQQDQDRIRLARKAGWSLQPLDLFPIVFLTGPLLSRFHGASILQSLV
jgi:hypothetical protein